MREKCDGGRRRETGVMTLRDSKRRAHRPRSRNPGPEAQHCSRCWLGARPSRRRACGSGRAWCRTARRPGAASPASLCSVGRCTHSSASLPVPHPQNLPSHPVQLTHTYLRCVCLLHHHVRLTALADVPLLKHLFQLQGRRTQQRTP